MCCGLTPISAFLNVVEGVSLAQWIRALNCRSNGGKSNWLYLRKGIACSPPSRKSGGPAFCKIAAGVQSHDLLLWSYQLTWEPVPYYWAWASEAISHFTDLTPFWRRHTSAPADRLIFLVKESLHWGSVPNKEQSFYHLQCITVIVSQLFSKVNHHATVEINSTNKY